MFSFQLTVELIRLYSEGSLYKQAIELAQKMVLELQLSFSPEANERMSELQDAVQR